MHIIYSILIIQIGVLALIFTFMYLKLQQSIRAMETRLMIDMQAAHQRITNLAKTLNLTDRPATWQDGFRPVEEEVQLNIDREVGFLK